MSQVRSGAVCLAVVVALPLGFTLLRAYLGTNLIQ